jgi:hypothetical protein
VKKKVLLGIDCLGRGVLFPFFGLWPTSTDAAASSIVPNRIGFFGFLFTTTASAPKQKHIQTNRLRGGCGTFILVKTIQQIDGELKPRFVSKLVNRYLGRQ